MLSQIEYVVAVLQSTQSQHSLENLILVILHCFLIRTCVCDKKFNFLNIQIYSGPKLCFVYGYISKNEGLYMLI